MTCSCNNNNNTLNLTFSKLDFLNSFTTTGDVGNSKGFVGSAIVTAYDTRNRAYRIFFNINSIDEEPTVGLIRNNVTISVSSVRNLDKNLLTTTFNTNVYKSNYDNVPGVYTSNNGSKLIVSDNGNARQLILKLH
jgi:hypothetical protein